MDDETVAQFTAITSATPERAQQYLTLSDGNLEQAVQLFFESGGVDMGGSFGADQTQSTSRIASGQADDAIAIDSDEDHSDGGAALGTQQAPNTEDDEAMARRMQEEMYGAGGVGGVGLDVDPETGVRRPMARTAEVLAAPSYSFNDPDELQDAVREQMLARQRRPAQRPGIFNQQAPSHSVWDDEEDPDRRRENLARATGGASEATSKTNRLAELYRPPFDIISPLVSWEGIRAQGKESEKWILLNVQDPNIFDCQVLNRDIWKHPEIKETVKENFIFKQYTKDDPQAQNYVRYYFHAADSQDAYPHIAIVDPRTGEQVKVWSGAPAPKPMEFLTQLHEFLDRYSLKANSRNPVATRKAEKKKVDVDRMTEEEMLEMAMQNSLDNNKAGPKADDPDLLTRQGESALSTDKGSLPSPPAEKETAEATPFAQISPSNPHVEPAADEPNTTRIQFRHPGGRVIRRFALSDPVRRLFEWLKASPLETREGQTFELIFMGTNLMSVVDSTIGDAGLRNGSVMVEFVEE